jgi:LPS export ABC transporter protein LptC
MRKRYLLLVLTILVGFALLAVDNYTQDSSAPLSDNQAAEPDYSGAGLFNRRFNERGELQQTFSAERSTHYPSTNSTVFRQPVIQLQDEEGVYWQVSADEGSMSDSDDLLRLRSNVEIRPLKANNRDEVIIRTPSLEYFTRQQLAQTDERVTILHPQTRMTAIGMRMDLKKQRMELNAKVDTRYVPQ